MRILLIAITCCLSHAVLAQKPDSYFLRWNIEDSLTYKVAFEQVEFKDENPDKSDTSPLSDYLSKLAERIVEEFKDYKLESTIKKIDNIYDVTFYFGGFPILNGHINESGDLLTDTEGTSVNFFKIFYDLPNQQIKVGDSWASNLKIQKTFQGITLTDSTKTDVVIFEELINEDGDELAVLKYEFRENYKGSFTDEDGLRKEAKIEILFDTKGHFNISKGRWKRLDGVTVFDYTFPEEGRTVMRLGLIQKKNE